MLVKQALTYLTVSIIWGRSGWGSGGQRGGGGYKFSTFPSFLRAPLYKSGEGVLDGHGGFVSLSGIVISLGVVDMVDTGWRRLIGSLIFQVIFRKRYQYLVALLW